MSEFQPGELVRFYNYVLIRYTKGPDENDEDIPAIEQPEVASKLKLRNSKY